MSDYATPPAGGIQCAGQQVNPCAIKPFGADTRLDFRQLGIA